MSGDTLTNNQLTFTTTNWNTAQTITVTPVKDDNAAGETITLTHTVSGGDYAGIAADSVTVNLTDSDARNLVLSEESLAVTEGDATGVGYTVKLATQPSDTVTVTISGHDGADLTLSGTTLTNNQLTFTTTNWGTAQTVTVKAGEDDDADNESETLAHTASGGDYVNITKDLPVSGHRRRRGGHRAQQRDGPHRDGGRRRGVELHGGAGHPALGQRVGLHYGSCGHGPDAERDDADQQPVDLHHHQLGHGADGDGQGGPGRRRRHRHRNADAHRLGGDYVNLTVDLPVTVTDDDTPAIVLSETDLTLTEGDAAGSSYTVKLVTRPAGSVSVSITGPPARTSACREPR